MNLNFKRMFFSCPAVCSERLDAFILSLCHNLLIERDGNAMLFFCMWLKYFGGQSDFWPLFLVWMDSLSSIPLHLTHDKFPHNLMLCNIFSPQPPKNSISYCETSFLAFLSAFVNNTVSGCILWVKSVLANMGTGVLKPRNDGFVLSHHTSLSLC